MMVVRTIFISTVLLLFFVAPSPLRSQVTLEPAFPNLTFQNPVDLQNAGDGTNRLFVVDQQGRIIVFQNSPTASVVSTFLDITDRVHYGGEMGLLGLAFHPQFESNGFPYVNYVAANPLRSVIPRFHLVGGNPDKADSFSEAVLFTVNQPYENHNGGQLAFGPDGFLYIALGDGGSGGDPQNNAQNLGTLLGKIFRIDVNSSGQGNYGIPPDNPYAGNMLGYREEIWAHGLRNPWRFSFDTVTGTLWCGDVGQDAREEIDIVEKGNNCGWRIMEGAFCYNPSTGCNSSGLTLPVWDYGRTVGSSITGGFVYRGARAPDLTGRYIFGDFGSGYVAALAYDGVNPPVVTPLDTLPAYNLTSFGIDEDNELYACSFDGKIYRFGQSAPTGISAGLSVPMNPVLANYPDPFNPTTTLEYHVPPRSDFVTLKIYDQLGREVALLVEGEKSPGVHTIRWDASGFAGGIYYARLFLGGIQSAVTEQLVLLR